MLLQAQRVMLLSTLAAVGGCRAFAFSTATLGLGLGLAPSAARLPSSSRQLLLRQSRGLMLLRAKETEQEEEKQTGHRPPAGASKTRSPEDEALSLKIQEHQQGAARLSKTEEVRTLVQLSNGFGVLSTNAKKMEGYPNGSVVGFGLDESGRPLFAFSTMSSHTNDLLEDGRASLTVMSATFKGASDGRVTLTGDVSLLRDEEKEAAKAQYKEKHPTAFWVDFGDFKWMRMDTIKAIRFVGGFAMAGDIQPDEYYKTEADPVAAFAGPVLSHMNADHSESTKAMVQHYITGGVPVESAELVGLDRLGMYVVVGIKGEKGKLRLPFPRPAADRKSVKELIVEMTQASSSSS